MSDEKLIAPGHVAKAQVSGQTWFELLEAAAEQFNAFFEGKQGKAWDFVGSQNSADVVAPSFDGRDEVMSWKGTYYAVALT